MATARSHLDRTRMCKPHADSQSVSALRRFHDSQIISALKRTRSQTPEPFSINKPLRSRTLHMDYTGELPTPCTSGVQYFQIACWGHFIDIQPLTSLRAVQITKALAASVDFFRSHGIILDTLRMDNQQSYDLRETARILKLEMEFTSIAPEVKRPNRAERAIRTAKNQIIASRAGFHPDCSDAYLDKCLPQIVITLSFIHHFEYNDSISAYHGVHGKRFNFNHRQTIADLGWTAASKQYVSDLPWIISELSTFGFPPTRHLELQIQYGGLRNQCNQARIYYNWTRT
jgi:hypothetical protein